MDNPPDAQTLVPQTEESSTRSAYSCSRGLVSSGSVANHYTGFHAHRRRAALCARAPRGKRAHRMRHRRLIPWDEMFAVKFLRQGAGRRTHGGCRRVRRRLSNGMVRAVCGDDGSCARLPRVVVARFEAVVGSGQALAQLTASVPSSRDSRMPNSASWASQRGALRLTTRASQSTSGSR